MTSLLRSWHQLVLPALLLASGSVSAQQVIRPLSADPGREKHLSVASAAEHQRTAALPLPFFDDFTSPLEGPPSPLRWLPGGGTLVSNRLAVNPPTRGAVTFDGLQANGTSYSNQVANVYSTIDVLTSQPIDLGGKTVADSVYLSFAWQTGSLIGGTTASSSSTPVRLDLQFLPANSTRWVTAPGWLAAPNFLGRSTGVPTTPFRQVIIPINQAQFLHGNFQFRFVATGNSSYAADTWSVDYVVLDQRRGPSPSGVPDTTFVDVATSSGLGNLNRSGGLNSPLRRYTAMPVWQFTSNELTNQLGVNVSNLNSGFLPLPVRRRGTVRELNSGINLGTWLDDAMPVTFPTVPQRLTASTGDASSLAIAPSSQPIRLRYTFALGSLENTPLTLSNDTIFRDVDLNSYYAYDDGSAEALFTFFPRANPPASILAYRFDLNRPDRVRGLRLYPIFPAGDVSARTVTVHVWGDSNGQPGTLLDSKTVTIPYPLPAGWQYFEASFNTPVPVSGVFYVGFSQPPGMREINYGFDLNSIVPENYSFMNLTGTWTPTPARDRTRGTMMMRPVMNNNVATASATARDAPAFALYPNPTRGSVAVAGPAFARAAVLDALGRTVWEQPAAEAGQRQLTLTGLAPGVYVLRLALPDGGAATRRLLVE